MIVVLLNMIVVVVVVVEVVAQVGHHDLPVLIVDLFRWF